MKVTETHYEFKVNWEQMKNWHWRRSFADELTPQQRAFHRRAAKTISARLKKNNELHSTGQNCVKLTYPKKPMKKNEGLCGICKCKCVVPERNANHKVFILCGKKKCRLQRRNELQREARKQTTMDFAKKPGAKKRVKGIKPIHPFPARMHYSIVEEELKKEEGRQRRNMKPAKVSKHDSHAKASKTSRAARQNWKSGATLVAK